MGTADHGVLQSIYELWTSPLAVNKSSSSWHCDSTLLTCSQTPVYCPEERQTNWSSPLPMKSLHLVRKALALVKTDMLQTVQKDSRCHAGAQHRCSFSCSKFSSSFQDCSRSRDNMESKNTIINHPGQSWLKASLLNKLWVMLDYCSPEKEGMEMGQRVSFLLLLERWVQWGAEWGGKAALTGLPHTCLSCHND